ncbi:DNA-binding response regulator [Nocardia sp. KC 131]|uniref:DNA-binding response regulator n=1 Tax=Nocardia arseniciresistens TaxID=3392119 RepID=UPI00398F3C8C
MTWVEGGADAPRRIGLVEDHESVAIGLAAMLAPEPDLDLVLTAGTVPELLAAAAVGLAADAAVPLTAARPVLDLVVLDLRLADGSSPEDNVRALRDRGMEVLVFTGADNAFLVRAAAKAGVLGVVRKSENLPTVVAAVRRAASGEQVVTTDWAAAIDGDPQLSNVGLSPRQEEVLTLYASGEKASRVARLTGLSEQTVNDYLGRIRQKYSDAGRPAPTKTDLYKRAVEDGWLPVPERIRAHE